METELTTTTPFHNTVTVRRNPPRRARPTPTSNAPLPTTTSITPRSISRKISQFPLDDILAEKISTRNPNPGTLNTDEPISGNLKVFLRIRPLNVQQISGKSTKNGGARSKNVWPQNPTTKNATKGKVAKKKGEICVKVNDDAHSVTLLPPQNLQDLKRIKSEVYEGFSHVFSANSTQEEVYNQIVDPLVEDFIKGRSGMFAALGPSGSGKTHTVFGTQREPGMVPRALRNIFSKSQKSKTHLLRRFYISMFEIYSEGGKGERIFDLSQDGGEPCMQKSTIRGLKEAVVADAQQAESLIALGMAKRTTAMTNSNNQSSRSQCIINIRSCPTNIDGEVDDHSQSALLTIVDLAGAEREKRTGNQGARLLESNFINNTSMVFCLCLRSLLEHQKNPKKPLQKHFQSSLLTKYLRDYLEGKKRMTLILTVKSGEEDYLDASYLLRQASPFMKIKFDSVEEPSNANGNKRQFQTLPRVEYHKRMKLSSFEVCTESEGNREEDCQRPKASEVSPGFVKDVEHTKVSVHSATTTGSEANGASSVPKIVINFAERDRENQIMQGFARALWNVLKQYKNKLKDSENEIQCLRDSLASEKARSSDLERELNDFKSCHSCVEEVSEEMKVEFRDHESAKPIDYAHGDNSHGNVQYTEEVGVTKDLEGDYTCLDGKAIGSGILESPVQSSHLLMINTDNASSSIEGNVPQNKEEQGDNSHGNVQYSEDVGDTKDLGGDYTCWDGKTIGSRVLESPVRSSHLLMINNDNASSSTGGNIPQNEEEVSSSAVESDICLDVNYVKEQRYQVYDRVCNLEEVKVGFGDHELTKPVDYEHGDNSIGSLQNAGNVQNAQDIGDTKDLGCDCTCLDVKTIGSKVLESPVRSSHLLMINTDNASSSTGGNIPQNEEEVSSSAVESDTCLDVNYVEEQHYQVYDKVCNLEEVKVGFGDHEPTKPVDYEHGDNSIGNLQNAGNVQYAEDVGDTKDLGGDYTSLDGKTIGSRVLESPVRSSHLLMINTDTAFSSTGGNIPQNEEEVSSFAVERDICLDVNYVEEQRYQAYDKVCNLEEVKVGFGDQEPTKPFDYEHGDNSIGNLQNAGNVQNAEDVGDTKDLGGDCTCLDGRTIGSRVLDSPVRSSHLLMINTDNASSSTGGNIPQNEEEVSSSAVESEICVDVNYVEEQRYQAYNKVCNLEELKVGFGDHELAKPFDYEHGDNSIGNVQNAEEVGDMKELGGDCTCLDGKAIGSGILESPILSSHLLMINTDNASSSTEGNIPQIEEENGDGSPQEIASLEKDAKYLEETNDKEKDDAADIEEVVDVEKEADDLQEIVAWKKDAKYVEDEARDIICSLSTEVSESKPLNPPKPKRRLLPASSILLKNTTSLDFDDENESVNRKGNRGGEKKVSVDTSKRSQGSISLFHLLTENLKL